MFKTNNYAFHLIEKENKHLLRENEYLKKQIGEVDQLKKEYQDLINNLRSYKKQYSKLLDRLGILELEMTHEMKNIQK